MKYIKILGLAAVAAMALMAFLGASSASATVLCSTNSTPCGAPWTYPANTKIIITLGTESSAVLKSTGGAIEDTCTGSSMEGVLENAGGSSSTAGGKASSLSFSGCSSTTDVLELGELEVHSISGTGNGTVTAKGFKVTITLAGVSCTYGAGTGTDLGTLTGGSSAKVDINAVVSKVAGSFLCPSDSRWEAAGLEVTAPVPLFIVDN